MPVNLFDASFYRAANSDLAGLNDAQVLAHFQTSGLNEGRAFSPVADLNFYRASNSDLATFNNQQAFEHLQNTGVAEGRRFSPVADLNYYLTVNPDLDQAFSGNRERAFEHLRNSGVNEGRSFSPFVDLNYYLSTNPDLNQAFGGNRAGALQHLEISGLNEGRSFSPAFDVNYYRNTYPDLISAGLTTNSLLFSHWVSNGAEIERRSGTSLDPGNTIDAALNLNNPPSSVTLFNGSLDSSDTNDYYRFSLSGPQNIGLQLTGLSANLDLSLLDSNGNAFASSTGSGSASEAINFISLNAGTYFIRVTPSGNASSDYSLYTSILAAQNPGNATNTAYPLNTPVSPLLNISSPPLRSVTREFVGANDTEDYYQFILTRDASFSASLTGLSANADLYLRNSANADLVTPSTQLGNSDETISTNLSAGTYFVRITGSETSTDYRLQLDAT